MNAPCHNFDYCPITGLSHDRIRAICSGEDMGPLPTQEFEMLIPREPYKGKTVERVLVLVFGLLAAYSVFLLIAGVW